MEAEETTPGALAQGEVAQEFLREVLAAMHFSADVELVEQEDGSYWLDVVGEDAGRIIGRHGNTLNALQYLTGLVTQKQTGEYSRLTVDADGYRERRQTALIEQARELAAAVIEAGQEAELDPLPAYERRIIHNALMEHPEVVTYSEGEGDERRVIIAPRPAAQA
jgi:spoIIIJ-associated protein